MDLAADGEMVADLVRAKLADLEAERARLRAELAQASAAVPEPGAVAGAIQRALSELVTLLRDDPAGRATRSALSSMASRSRWSQRQTATSSTGPWT